MSIAKQSGRLSLLAAAFVVARRDFSAILFSRSFFFFLLGPLFPIVIGLMAGGVGQQVNDAGDHPVLGVAMAASDVDAMLRARAELEGSVGRALPDLAVVKRLSSGDPVDATSELRKANGQIAALLTGTLAAPVLTGSTGRIEQWQGPVSLLAAQALGQTPQAYPEVALAATASSPGGDLKTRLITAQAAQTLLFLLTMLLAGMVLSNLVEEKSNKIIEVLAAAIPMDAVFLGKLFAMLGVSFVGIAVWGSVGGATVLLAGSAMESLPVPAVGWPLMLTLGVVYFAMAYLLLGSVFLSIGSMASTVREVQTLSMPVTMLQLMNFFLASYAMTQPGSTIEMAAMIIPFSSPFAMLARAAQDGAILPQLLAIAWQALWVLIFVRVGAKLFRSRVMKSGPAKMKAPRRKLLSRLKPARV
jgi:ABC-2 type transport system permease protein